MMALFIRDFQLAARHGGGAFMSVLFFLTLVALMPFALGPSLNLLALVGPAILWIGALLSMLIGLDRLFQNDQDDGSLDLLLISGHPLMGIVGIKCLAHWIATGFPVVLATPFLGLFVHLSPQAMAVTALTLLVGTPALVFFGAVGSALTLNLRRGGLLMPILILPFCVPSLIFGMGSINGLLSETRSFLQPFLFLCAYTLVSMVVGVLGATVALSRARE